MSVIAVKKLKSEIHMSADSQTTFGHNKFHTKKDLNRSKIFTTNGMIFGCAGNVSDICLLQVFSKTHKPKHMTSDDMLEFLVEFSEWAKKKDSAFSFEIHGIMVLGGSIVLFMGIEVHMIDDFASVGSGSFLALGAMYNGANTEKAVETAIRYDLYCGAPVETIKVKI